MMGWRSRGLSYADRDRRAVLRKLAETRLAALTKTAKVAIRDKLLDVETEVGAVREFIRREGDSCIVPISVLLDELSDKFGNRFRMSPDMHNLVDLIVTLWTDPHVDQPEPGWIDFAWNEQGFDHDQAPATGFEGNAARPLSDPVSAARGAPPCAGVYNKIPIPRRAAAPE